MAPRPTSVEAGHLDVARRDRRNRGRRVATAEELRSAARDLLVAMHGRQSARTADHFAAGAHGGRAPTDEGQCRTLATTPPPSPSHTCGVRRAVDACGRKVAEVWYDAAHGGSGVVRLHFRTGFSPWEDANSDHVRALGSVLASTAHRCGEEEQSHHHATRDSLTGLLNRRELLGATATWHGAEELAPVAVVFVDLNGFKAVNDTLGHGTRDDVLRAAGDALRQAVRAHDLSRGS